MFWSRLKEKEVRKRALYLLELALTTAGLTLAAVYLGARLDLYLESRWAIQQFENAANSTPSVSAAAKSKANAPSNANATPAPNRELAAGANRVDLSLWSPTRARAYRASRAAEAGEPIALLQIPKIHLRVPVFNDDGELALNRGVGRIAGTAMPGASGNIGLAGHRDGFFRGLKDVKRGDHLDLVTHTGILQYVVDKIEIVSPKDVSVLQAKAKPSLTLVTCYPFYYLGHAPKRYVVEASLRNPSETGKSAPEDNLNRRK